MSSRQLLALPYNDCNLTNSIECSREVNVGISVMALCLGIILALSVAANGMVCFVFYRKSNLLSISNSFVLNLCCSELALSVLVLPFTLASVFSSSGWVFNDTWCKIQGFIFNVCVFSIQFSLMVISLDRNYAIINSLRYANVFTQRLANIFIALCWIISFILAVPPLLGWGSYKYVTYQYTCAMDWAKTDEFLITICVIVFLCPLLVQAICYLSIFKAAISHTKRTSRVYPTLPSSTRGLATSIQDPPSDCSDVSDVSQNIQVKNRNMECKAVRTILLIAFTYSLCWTPYFVVSFLRLRSVKVTPYSDSAAVCFIFLTGIINPVIYVFMNRVMRFEINKFFCGQPSKDSRKTSSRDDNDEFYSTTTMSVSVPKTTTSSSSSQTRTNGKNRRIEMKTIKEEEVELESVFHPNLYPSEKETEISACDLEKETFKTNEIFLNPSDLYLQRKRVKTKKERLMSIREESIEPACHAGPSGSTPCQYLEDLDVAWNPCLVDKSHTHHKHRRSRTNSLGLKKDETFSKRYRDVGSFLYFEHQNNSNNHYEHNRRQGRGFSVDGALFRQEKAARKITDRHHSLHEGMRRTTDIFIKSETPIPNSFLTTNCEHTPEGISGSDPELNRKTASSNRQDNGSETNKITSGIIHVCVYPQPKRDCLSA